MVSRRSRLVALVAFALVASLAVVEGARTGDDRLKDEALATCWDCHKVVQNDCPPLQTFVGLLPSDGVGGAPGDQFDFTVQVQNAWCAEFYGVRVNLDLTNAPSLGFASGVPPVEDLIHAAIDVNPQAASQPQRSAPIAVPIPAGETRLEVVLRPGSGGQTGSDVALLVYPPGTDPNGAPAVRRDEADQGGDESFLEEEPANITPGLWNFVVEGSLLPAPDRGVLVPGPDGSVPFELAVNAVSEATGARLGSLEAASPSASVKEASSVALTFKLVAVGEPAEGESVALSADVWPHYTHKSTRPDEDDDENVTKVHPAPVPVLAEGGRAILRSDAAPATIVATPANGPTITTASEAVGYATAFLLAFSIVTGGMFGKASRRGLNHVFGNAKRRVAFHNFLSYGILLAASAHTVLFIVEAAYHWSLGLLWGGAAVLALLGLGVTGAWQVGLIRKWGYGGWRWTHYGLAVAVLVFTLVHMLLDGAHFTDIQDQVGWRDPVVKRFA